MTRSVTLSKLCTNRMELKSLMNELPPNDAPSMLIMKRFKGKHKIPANALEKENFAKHKSLLKLLDLEGNRRTVKLNYKPNITFIYINRLYLEDITVSNTV